MPLIPVLGKKRQADYCELIRQGNQQGVKNPKEMPKNQRYLFLLFEIPQKIPS